MAGRIEYLRTSQTDVRITAVNAPFATDKEVPTSRVVTQGCPTEASAKSDTVEVSLVGEDEMVGLEMFSDKHLVCHSVALVALDGRTRYLRTHEPDQLTNGNLSTHHLPTETPPLERPPDRHSGRLRVAHLQQVCLQLLQREIGLTLYAALEKLIDVSRYYGRE